MSQRIEYLAVITLLMLGFSNQVTSQIQADESKTIRVLSFNILHGATTKGDFDLDVIAKLIRNAEPDFVALQEVDFKTNRALKYDLATELAYRTKLIPLFGKAMDYDDGEYGEGVLSKYTFISSRNVSLPYSEGNEPRAALEIVTSLASGDTIAFIGTHLDHLRDDTDRVLQTSRINDVFRKNKFPTILAGDLNDIPGSQAINILEELWTPSYDPEKLAFTFPSGDPVKKIDYVMFYPANRWRVIKTEVINDAIASDHCAYLVVLELLDKN